MSDFKEAFRGLLEKEDKAGCIDLVMSELESGGIEVVTLYTEVLANSLNHMFNDQSPSDLVIWKEHVRSSIVRSVIENCYRYVVKAAEPANGESVVVICPPEELHEIGARMVADFFTLCGYDVTFVGANTPVEDFLAVVRSVKPSYVAISVTNYYNLLAVKKAIAGIRKASEGGSTIIVGGSAFRNNPDAVATVGADRLLHGYEDIKAMRGGA